MLSFKLEKTIESIYTGGKVIVSRDLTKIFTTLGEDILVTDYLTGQKLAELKGVGIRFLFFLMVFRIPTS